MQHFYDRQGWSASVPVTGEGLVAIPRAYHPTVAAPGTTLFYLWALASPVEEYRVKLHEAFAYMEGEETAETTLRQSSRR